MREFRVATNFLLRTLSFLMQLFLVFDVLPTWSTLPSLFYIWCNSLYWNLSLDVGMMTPSYKRKNSLVK